MAGFDYVKAQAVGRLAAAEAMFAMMTGDYTDLFVQDPDGGYRFCFYDGEMVTGVEAAADRAEQHVGSILRAVAG